MSQFDIGLQRLVNQHVTQPRFAHPHEVVQWLGAMQAQDYLGALDCGLQTRPSNRSRKRWLKKQLSAHGQCEAPSILWQQATFAGCSSC